MENDLKKMEDDLKKNGRRPQNKLKTTSKKQTKKIVRQPKNNGRRPEEKNGR
jgi:hypothetical protein